MSDGLSDRTTCTVTGGIGLVFSLFYVASARRIEDSMLADAVGASGVPVGVGVLMALASAALLVKGLLPAATTQAAASSGQRGASDSLESATPGHLLAAGLLAILLVYLLVLPWLGYIVSIGFMAAAVARFAGGREAKALLGFALLTGPLLWFLFDFVLKVRMPKGFWPTLLSG